MIANQAILSHAAASPNWYWGGSFHPWFLFGFFFWLLPLIVFGLLVVLAARWLYRGGNSENFPHGASTSSLTILEERYAKGEITKEQFEQIRKDIERRG
jgi:putative membrane protein